MNTLCIYRKFDKAAEAILKDMNLLCERHREGLTFQEGEKDILVRLTGRLIKYSENKGFYGNLWHCFLTELLVNHENAFSLECELGTGGSYINKEDAIVNLALKDMQIIYEWFHCFDSIDSENMYIEEALLIYRSISDNKLRRIEGAVYSGVYSNDIRTAICKLASELAGAQSPSYMLRYLVCFYEKYGVGKLGLYKGFRVEARKGKVKIVPIANVAKVSLDDLVGYEIQKRKLVDNTEAFLEGKRANNCLMFGDAGTGKSTSMKALANQYYERGLRVIEIYKHQFKYLNALIAGIRNRNYKFIIFMDDLSFEDFEIEYKYLKAVIEGGLEEKPSNVLVYATSNRRHLIHERFSDKDGKPDFMHTSDTVQEKLSLAYRFGVTVYFSSPSPKEFQNIVTTLAVKYGVVMEEQKLLEEANKWELAHGGLSGRTAQQFIDYLLGIG